MKFSVVIPVYNKKPHIARMIKSLLHQTLQDFEVIVVDDSSTDGSIEEIKRLYGNKARYFRTAGDVQLGPGAARNIGVANARAEWIAFLDADDEWHPDHISQMNAQIKRFPEASVFSCGWYITGNGGSQHKDPHTLKYAGHGYHTIDFAEYLKRMRNRLAPIWTSVSVMKRSTLLEAGGFPENCMNSEDQDTWLRVSAISPIGWSPFTGAWYHREAVNRTAGRYPEYRCNIVATLDGMYCDTRYRHVRRKIRCYMNRVIVTRMTANARKGNANLSDLSNYSFIHSPFLFFQSLLLFLPKGIVNPLLKIRKAIVNRIKFHGAAYLPSSEIP